MLDRARKRRFGPFTLTGPDDRKFMAMSFEDLLRLTAVEFDPALWIELEAIFEKRRPPEKTPPDLSDGG